MSKFICVIAPKQLPHAAGGNLTVYQHHQAKYATGAFQSKSNSPKTSGSLELERSKGMTPSDSYWFQRPYNRHPSNQKCRWRALSPSDKFNVKVTVCLSLNIGNQEQGFAIVLSFKEKPWGATQS